MVVTYWNNKRGQLTHVDVGQLLSSCLLELVKLQHFSPLYLLVHQKFSCDEVLCKISLGKRNCSGRFQRVVTTISLLQTILLKWLELVVVWSMDWKDCKLPIDMSLFLVPWHGCRGILVPLEFTVLTVYTFPLFMLICLVTKWSMSSTSLLNWWLQSNHGWIGSQIACPLLIVSSESLESVKTSGASTQAQFLKNH